MWLFFIVMLLSSVYTSQLWIGHLSRHTTESELGRETERYGEVTAMNVSVGGGEGGYITRNLREGRLLRE